MLGRLVTLLFLYVSTGTKVLCKQNVDNGEMTTLKYVNSKFMEVSTPKTLMRSRNESNEEEHHRYKLRTTESVTHHSSRKALSSSFYDDSTNVSFHSSTSRHVMWTRYDDITVQSLGKHSNSSEDNMPPVVTKPSTMTETAKPEYIMTEIEREQSNMTEADRVESEAKKHILWVAGIGINQYFLPAILPVGFAGNILSFLVMLQRHNRCNSCCNYMAALSLTDFCMICVGTHYWVVTCGYFRGIYLYECKLIAWTFNLFPQAGIALIVSMTFDRFIAIRFPFQAQTICSPRRAQITATVVIVVAVIYTSPYFYTGGLINNNNNTCVAILEQTSFTTAYTWINMFLVSILPFFSLLMMNAAIIHGIHKRRRYLKKQHTSGEQKYPNSKDTHLTIMLLLVTFAYLALTLPLYVRYMLAMVLDYTKDAYVYALYIFIYHLSNKLYFMNSAINFYLYFISGSKFRQDLLRLCRKKTSEKTTVSIRSMSMNGNSETVEMDTI